MARRGWSIKQDQAVKSLVEKHGTKNWSEVAKQLCTLYKFKERTGKQCRQRYHNHLDPKISKRSWTNEEEEIIFKMHKVYGNKWTSIAQHLIGRTDNTIKNHFYSTIRRSLRRMSKLIGQKNSTKQMKYIKPSTLSKIFAINTKPSTSQQIQQEKRKCEENFQYEKLVNYINSECQELTDIILEFSSFKPKGKNCVLPPNQRVRFEKVLQKMQTLKQLIDKKNSEIYQDMRKQQRRINSTYKMNIDDSSSSSSELQQNESEEEIKIPKITRSKREIKPPKKYESQFKQLNPQKKQRKPILLKKNSQLIKQLQEKSPEISIYEKMELQKKQSDKLIDGPQINYKEPEFQILIKDNREDNEQVFSQFLLAQTPTISLPTSFYINTPALQLYQTPPGGISANSRGSGFFSHVPGTWALRNGELDDMISNLGSQIAKNTSENRQKDDGKTLVSQINCSPNSAFKTCH